MAFLKRISHTSDGSMARALREDGNGDDMEISSDEEDEAPIQNNTCSICLGVRLETYTLIPCGHSSLCRTCANTLLNNGHCCHMCRGEVENVLRIFL